MNFSKSNYLKNSTLGSCVGAQRAGTDGKRALLRQPASCASPRRHSGPWRRLGSAALALTRARRSGSARGAQVLKGRRGPRCISLGPKPERTCAAGPSWKKRTGSAARGKEGAGPAGLFPTTPPRPPLSASGAPGRPGRLRRLHAQLAPAAANRDVAPVTRRQRPDPAAGALRSSVPPRGAQSRPLLAAQMSVSEIAGAGAGGFAGFRLEGSLGGSESPAFSP